MAIRASCRWCLTGTPIQNRLDDFGALIGFIGVPFVELKSEFDYWITKPITRRKDYAFKRLRRLVKATCLRRTKANIESSLKLPRKEEVNIVLDLDPGERELYNFFKGRAATVARQARHNGPQRATRSGGRGGWSGNILPLVGHLRRICDHGEDLLPTAVLQAWRDRDIDSIDWKLLMMGSQKCAFCETELEEGDGVAVPVELPCGHFICANCRTTEDADDVGSSRASSCHTCSGKSPLPMSSQDSTLEEYKPSVKIDALLQNLRREHSTQPTSEDGTVSKRYSDKPHLSSTSETNASKCRF